MGSIDISQIKEHWEKYWVNNFSTKVKKMIKNNSVDINNIITNSKPSAKYMINMLKILILNY